MQLSKIVSLLLPERIPRLKEIRITGSKIKEALAQINTIEELGVKERGCLRLLTEEMFSMCHELLGVYSLDFEMKQDGKQYALSGITNTRVGETVRAHLLSVSSSGKNAENNGIRGILGAVWKLFSVDEAQGLCNANWAYGMCNEGDNRTWSLFRYMAEIEAVKGKMSGMGWKNPSLQISLMMYP